MRKAFLPLFLVTTAMFAYAPIIIADAPYQSTMLLIQKVFYFHVPAWWSMFIGVFAAGIGGAWFLWKNDPRGDRLAVSAVEVAVIFGAMGLVTGPLWAKKAWGVAWQWDAKLVMAALLELIFFAYLLLRRYGGPGSEKLAATVALFGMANVPFVYYAVDIWQRTIHPANTVVGTLPPGMRGAYWFCVVAFLLLFTLLLTMRMHLERLRTSLDELYLADEHAS